MKKFHQLIARDIFDCLTPDEKDELEAIREAHGISKEAYEKMKLTICSSELHKEIISHHSQRHYLKRAIRYAALFILPLSIASYLILKTGREKAPQPFVATAPAYFNEKPQPKQIKLILADGEILQLPHEQQETIIAPNIRNTGKSLQYTTTTVCPTDLVPAYNTIMVPAAGEFSIQLADGTQVWLNEKTELKYPVEFGPDSREIHLLEGEIYLEVARDSLHPFLVHTPNGKIQVLGTHFNIRCVSPQNIETTLVEGKVEVRQTDQKVILHPGQQATVTNRIMVKEVDVEEVICWKDNLFYFKDAELETILNKLADWYDFEIGWQNPELKTKRFFMSIDKYASVQEILDKLTDASGINFMINDKTVNVLSK